MWQKIDHIYNVSGKYRWNQTHAQLPTIDSISKNRWRIYFSTRDALGKSRISFIDVEAGNPQNILYEHHKPVLDLGELGTFDDSGVMPSCVISNGNKKYLYYTGWTTRKTVPYHNSIGLAISYNGGKSFERYSNGPIFGTTHTEPHFTGTSWVMIENDVWKNWYMSCTKWKMINNKPEPYYHIKYAESNDGINWQRNNNVAIDYKSNKEGGIVRASIIKENKLYKMWYSFRNITHYRSTLQNSYKIGYAESINGKKWIRKDDQINFSVSDANWDSSMMAYPYVISYNGLKYMFYNGNGFGQSGFGYAISK